MHIQKEEPQRIYEGELSRYTHVPMSVTPYAAGGSHSLLSERTHHESDRLWMYSVGRGVVWEGLLGPSKSFIQMQLIL